MKQLRITNVLSHPISQRWLPRPGTRAAGQPLSSLQDHTSFWWMGGISFTIPLTAPPSSLFQNTPGSEEGRRNEDRGEGSLNPPKIVFCFQVARLSRMSSLVRFLLAQLPQSLPAPKTTATKTSARTTAPWPPPPQLLQRLPGWRRRRPGQGRARTRTLPAREAGRLRASFEGRAVQQSPCGSRLGWERRRSQPGPPRSVSPTAAAAPAEAARARPPLTFKIRSV